MSFFLFFCNTNFLFVVKLIIVRLKLHKINVPTLKTILYMSNTTKRLLFLKRNVKNCANFFGKSKSVFILLFLLSMHHQWMYAANDKIGNSNLIVSSSKQTTTYSVGNPVPEKEYQIVVSSREKSKHTIDSKIISDDKLKNSINQTEAILSKFFEKNDVEIETILKSIFKG